MPWSRTAIAMASARKRLERAGFALLAMLTISGVGAALYRWVDDKGGVQYSDKPPDSKGKGAVEMSKRGVVTKKLDATPTPEQQKAKAAEEARHKAEEQQALAQRRADQALLQSFTNVQEIDLKRDRELHSLQSNLAHLRGQEQSANERLTEERKRLDVHAKQGETAPNGLSSDIARIEAELKRIRATADKRQQDITSTRAHYESLRARYLELRPTDTSVVIQGSGTASPVPAKK